MSDSRPHPAVDPLATADLLRRVSRAVGYSYEAGEYPPAMDPDVAAYMDGDGGLLRALGDAEKLARCMADAQLTLRKLRRERAIRASLHEMARQSWFKESWENARLRQQLDVYRANETEPPV